MTDDSDADLVELLVAATGTCFESVTVQRVVDRLATLRRERDEARAALVRHQTEPDAADPDGWVRRSALNHWSERASAAEAERDSLRAAVRDATNALGNGSCVAPGASPEFHVECVRELLTQAHAWRAERDSLQSRLDATRAAAAADLGRVERERDEARSAAEALAVDRDEWLNMCRGAEVERDELRGDVADLIAAARAAIPPDEYPAEKTANNWASQIRELGHDRRAAYKQRDEAMAERNAAMQDAADTYVKWHTKARVYGAIAARYQRALAKIDHPEARAAEAWRHSESCGVPRSALEEVQSLLDAQSALTRTTAAGKRLAEAVRWAVQVDGGAWFECEAPEVLDALRAWDRRDGEVG